MQVARYSSRMAGDVLHVANGHCTTGLIELSGLPGRTQIWADPLNEGPVPGDISDDELLLVRARFLARIPTTPATSPPISRAGAKPLTMRMATTSSCCGSSTICSIS